MGTWGLSFALGLMLGPSLGCRLYASNPMTLWLACGLLGLVAAGLMLVRPRPATSTVPA